MPGGLPASSSRHLHALESVLVALAALTIGAWFGTASTALVIAAAGALAVGVAWRVRAEGRVHVPRPHVETLVCLALAVAYRFPALLHPWGWVNRDGAYGAFVALHLLQGARPAPVFTEGANYQGTLKAHLSAALGLLTGS